MIDLVKSSDTRSVFQKMAASVSDAQSSDAHASPDLRMRLTRFSYLWTSMDNNFLFQTVIRLYSLFHFTKIALNMYCNLTW